MTQYILKEHAHHTELYCTSGEHIKELYEVRKEETMKCHVCKSHEAEWSWQPWGPGNEADTFTLPGSHYRGFPVIKVCAGCKEHIQQGQPVTVTYRGNAVCVQSDKGDNPHR